MDTLLSPDLPDTVPSRDEIRQVQRLPSGYKPLTGNLGFDPRLCFELSLGVEDAGSVFARYGYDTDAAIELARTPVFQKALKAYADDIRDNGLTFKAKARIAAEDLLVHAYEIATDAEAPPSVRADLIKWHAKVADLEPRQNQTPQQGNGFNLQILFSGTQTPALTLEGTTKEIRDDD